MTNLKIVIIITSFLTSSITVYLLRKIAIKKSLYDMPNDRSSHSVPTPRIGGIGIAIVWYSFILASLLFYNLTQGLEYILLSVLPITLISLVDDFIDIKAGTRFVIQCISVLISLILISTKFESINYSILHLTILGILFLGGVWFINLYNFLDGIDGFAASQAIIFFLISFYHTKTYFLLVLIAIILGFILFNWHPAKIFMGDTGSTLIGFIIFICAVIFHNMGTLNILLSLAFTSVFWFDASTTLFRRFLAKEKLTQAHKKHAYQRLTQAGFKHNQVVMLMLVIYCLIAISSYIFRQSNYHAVIVFVFSLIINSVYLLFAEKKSPFKVDTYRS